MVISRMLSLTHWCCSHTCSKSGLVINTKSSRDGVQLATGLLHVRHPVLYHRHLPLDSVRLLLTSVQLAEDEVLQPLPPAPQRIAATSWRAGGSNALGGPGETAGAPPSSLAHPPWTTHPLQPFSLLYHHSARSVDVSSGICIAYTGIQSFNI